MTVTVLPEVMQDMTESAYRQQVYIVAETQMHTAPWLFEDEGWEQSRLKAAIELVCTGAVTPTDDGWAVQGSTRSAVYAIPRATMQCSCKAAQHARKSQVCKHRVAVELLTRVQQASPQATPLPLGPATVDERLARAATYGRDTVYTDPAIDRGALTPEERRMTEDPEFSIPEPDEAPVALDARDDDCPPRARPTPEPPHVTQAVREGLALLPGLDARALEQSMQAWSAQRQVVKRFLQQELVEGTDYYTLLIKGRVTKPALSKAGSEKFLALFQLHAVFEQDTATWTMLGQPQGTLCYRCQLYTRSGEIVGEGRGARTIQQDGGDINKAVKMAQKSSCVDAILRTGALSDVFTQEEPETAAPAPARATPPTQALRQRIWQLVQARAPEVKSREAVEAYITEHTGMALHPDLYGAIVHRLEEGGR